MDIPKTQLVNRVDYILHLCKGKKILHLGCTSSPSTQRRIQEKTHLHMHINSYAREVYGVDIDIHGLNVMREYGFTNLYEGSVYELHTLGLPTDFDIVLAGELIEHLANPGLFLDSVRKCCSLDTLFVLTTPNSFSAKHWIHYLCGKEESHPEHMAFYSFATLHQLLTAHQFKIENWQAGMVTHMSKRSKLFTPVLGFVGRLCPRFGDSLIVECKVN